MKFSMRIINKEDWKALSKDAHMIAFSQVLDEESERIDFAFLGVDDSTNIPIGYITAKELERDVLHLNYGGGFPAHLGTQTIFKSYSAFIEWSKKNYKRLTTGIENTNQTMLKMAMKVGFIIQGVKLWRGKTLLLLELETGKGE